MARHGARYPTAKWIGRFAELEALAEATPADHPMPPSVAWLRQWRSPFRSDMAGGLSDEG